MRRKFVCSRSCGAAWVWANLNDNGNCGLAARNSNNDVANANWNGAGGAPGLCQISALVRRIFRAYVLKLCRNQRRLVAAANATDDTNREECLLVI